MDDFLFRFIITFPIFIFSLTIHEAAHAITARWGGDLTAAYLGRVTLNPIPHIDPIGTIFMPLAGAISGVPLIGWAKPVPVVEQNYRRGDGYGVVVALAGPFSNLLIALFTVALLMLWNAMMALLPSEMVTNLIAVHRVLGVFAVQIIWINLMLMFFNLIPIPPLDGSHLLWHWFVKSRPQFWGAFEKLRGLSMFILLILLFTGLIGLLFTGLVLPVFNVLYDVSQIPLR